MSIVASVLVFKQSQREKTASTAYVQLLLWDIWHKANRDLKEAVMVGITWILSVIPEIQK